MDFDGFGSGFPGIGDCSVSKTVEIISIDPKMKPQKFKDMDKAGLSEGEAFVVLQKGKRTIMLPVHQIVRVNIENDDE